MVQLVHILTPSYTWFWLSLLLFIAGDLLAYCSLTTHFSIKSTTRYIRTPYNACENIYIWDTSCCCLLNGMNEQRCHRSKANFLFGIHTKTHAHTERETDPILSHHINWYFASSFQVNNYRFSSIFKMFGWMDCGGIGGSSYLKRIVCWK